MPRKIWQQLTLILLPLIAAVAALGWLTFTASAAELRLERRQPALQDWERGLRQLAADVNRHRTASLAVLGGDARFEVPLAQFRREISAEFESLDSLAAPGRVGDAALGQQWDRARDRWEFVRAYHLFRTPAESNELHVRLQTDLMALASRAADLGSPVKNAGLSLNQQWLLLGLSLALGLGLSLSLAGLVGRRWSRQLHSVSIVCEGVEAGHYSARVPVRHADEVGQMAEAVNQLLDQTEDFHLFREAHDRLQGGLLQLLEDVHCLAEGDLAREVVAAPDLPGPLVEAFLNMVQRFRLVIGAIQVAVIQLSASAQHIQALSATLMEEADSRPEQVTLATQTLDELIASSQQLARNTLSCASAAEQTVTAAHDGNAAVRLATQAVNALRSRLDVTARHARRLGENSPDVLTAVGQFDDLSRWSALLAGKENGTHANGAGHGTASVTERISLRAAEVGRHLSSLTVLHHGLRKVGASLEEASREAVHGTLLASQAGQAALSAETAAQQLARLSSESAVVVRQQGVRVEALTRSLQLLRQNVQKAARDGRQNASAVNDLARLTNELQSVIGYFRVPEDAGGLSSVLSVDGSLTLDGRHWKSQDSDEDSGAMAGHKPVGVEALSEK